MVKIVFLLALVAILSIVRAQTCKCNPPLSADFSCAILAPVGDGTCTTLQNRLCKGCFCDEVGPLTCQVETLMTLQVNDSQTNACTIEPKDTAICPAGNPTRLRECCTVKGQGTSPFVPCTIDNWSKFIRPGKKLSAISSLFTTEVILDLVAVNPEPESPGVAVVQYNAGYLFQFPDSPVLIPDFVAIEDTQQINIPAGTAQLSQVIPISGVGRTVFAPAAFQWASSTTDDFTFLVSYQGVATGSNVPTVVSTFDSNVCFEYIFVDI